MLEQAIIDAEELRKTAMKIAEQSLLEKHSVELKKNIDRLLEQQEDDESELNLPSLESGGDGKQAIGKETSKQLPTAGIADLEGTEKKDEENKEDSEEEDDEEIEINMMDLQREIEGGVTEPASNDQEEIILRIVNDDENELDVESDDELGDEFDEELENDEDKQILHDSENLRENENIEGGYGQRQETGDPAAEDWMNLRFPDEESDEDQRHGIEITDDGVPEEGFTQSGLPPNASSGNDVDIENAGIRKATREFEETEGRLKEQVSTLSNKLKHLSEHFKKTNVLNAKLLYTNKVLSNSSLNERQKKPMTERLAEAKTVEEAKLIYETFLKMAGKMEGKSSKDPESSLDLNKMTNFAKINESKQNSQKARVDEVVKNRWKQLAGI
jgi:hypothetical protein